MLVFVDGCQLPALSVAHKKDQLSARMVLHQGFNSSMPPEEPWCPQVSKQVYLGGRTYAHQVVNLESHVRQFLDWT